MSITVEEQPASQGLAVCPGRRHRVKSQVLRSRLGIAAGTLGIALSLVAGRPSAWADDVVPANSQASAGDKDASAGGDKDASAGAAGSDASVATPSAPAPASAPIPVQEAPQAPPTEPPLAGLSDIKDLADLDLESLLENVVVSATKAEVKEDEAPAIATVISREEILRWGYQSVDEVLSHVVGLYGIDDHITPNLAVRGVSSGARGESSLVKVMIDGRSVAFRSTSGNWLGPQLVPLSIVQQIEVIRGPASALYGADAFMGVINIVTRRPDQIQGGAVSVAANHEGQYGWGHDAAVGATKGSWDFFASWRMNSEDRSGLQLPNSSPAPRLPSYASADRASHELKLSSDVALVRVGRRLGERGTLTLTGYYSAMQRGAEFADWAQLTHGVDAAGRSNGTNVALRQGSVDLTLSLKLTDKIDLRVNGLVFAGGPTSKDQIDVGSDIYYVKRDFGYRGVDAGTEVSWQPRKNVSVLWTAGFIFDREQRPLVTQVTKTVDGGASITDNAAVEHINLSNAGVSGQLIWSPVTRLNLVAGGRYDYHNIYGGKPSARLGGVVTLLPNLHFKLLYGSAFKAPSFQLLYGTPAMIGDIAGNPALKPAYVHTGEAQLSYRPNNYMLITTGVAYSYLLDQAEFQQVGLNQVARNVARVESLSWETELKADYKKLVAGYANFALNRTRRHTDEVGYQESLSNYSNATYPRVIVNAGVSAMVPRLPLRLSGEVTFVSARPSSAANTLEYGQRYDLPAYALVGASIRTVGLELLPKRETVLALVGRNLADRRVADPGFAGIDYPRLGRTVMLQLIQNF